MTTKLRVGVIFGGRSGEHEVSLVSAESVIGRLDRKKFEVVPIGITKEGAWVYGDDSIRVLKEAAEMPQLLADGLAERLAHVAMFPDPTKRDLAVVKASDNLSYIQKLDVIFPVLHGTFGEDGTIQGLFEMADIPYVGCGVLASACAMDKIVSKTLFKDAGLRVAPFVYFTRAQWEGDAREGDAREGDAGNGGEREGGAGEIENGGHAGRLAIMAQIKEKLGFPCFSKPANLGSSVGISKVKTEDALETAIDEAARYDARILVEKGINAREIECSVLGNDEARASLPGEIFPANEFYDYEAKYIKADSRTQVPADLTEEQIKEVQAMSISAFHALDCAGMARVDFLLDRDTGEIYINEINTIPGFTSISMYPKMWEASGVPYTELLTELVELAIARHREKSKNSTTYEGTKGWHKKE